MVVMKMLPLSSPLLYRLWRRLLLILPLLLLLQDGCRRQKNSDGIGVVGGVVVMAQEAPNPRLQIPPFAETPSFRQDFCNITRHKNNNSNYTSNIGSLLQGVALNSIILMGEFIKFENNGETNSAAADIFNYNNDQMLNRLTLPQQSNAYPGLVARIMDEVCRRAGCTWRNTYSIVGAIPPNTTWSELLIWTTEVYDISVEWWMRSTDRMRHGAAFTEPWYVCIFLYSA
jgi:hypothetical protein